MFEELKKEDCTLVFYEAPHRILETLQDIVAVLPQRPVVIARELTKMHEEFLRGSAAELYATLSVRPSVKGEITLLIGKAEHPEADDTPIEEAIRTLEANGVARMDAIKQVAKARGLSKREVYKLTV